MTTDSDFKYTAQKEGQLLANARQLMLSCAVLFAAAPVSAVILYKFIGCIPKMYFIVFLCAVIAALTGCMVLCALAMWNFSAGQANVRNIGHNNSVRAGLLKSALIVFFSAVGVFSVGLLAATVFYLIFM